MGQSEPNLKKALRNYLGRCVYINGQEAHSWEQSSNPNSNTNPVMIGYNYNAASVHYWDGRLDEVRLYNHVLTPSEVSAYCDATSPSLCTCSDEDNDGVPDSWDECPQTPAGSLTDSVGCSGKGGVVVIPMC